MNIKSISYMVFGLFLGTLTMPIWANQRPMLLQNSTDQHIRVQFCWIPPDEVDDLRHITTPPYQTTQLKQDDMAYLCTLCGGSSVSCHLKLYATETASGPVSEDADLFARARINTVSGEVDNIEYPYKTKLRAKSLTAWQLLVYPKK